MIFRAISIGILGLAISACGAAMHTPAADKVTAEKITSFDALESEIFKPKCGNCHNPVSLKGGVDLTSYAATLASKGAIVPGHPDQSNVYIDVAKGDMPDGGPALSAAEVQAIGEWIQAGAPNGEFRPTPTGIDLPLVDPPVPYGEVQTKVFDQYCTRCHAGAKPKKGVDLSSYVLLMSNPKKLVVPGQPEQSPVYTEIVNGNMPPKGAPVAPADLALLKAWILQGAGNI